MKYFSMLIKPSSSKCMLKCRYCFYNDIASIRDVAQNEIINIDTIKMLLDKVFAQFNEETTITFAFQGGEPLCCGIEIMQNFVDLVKKYKKDIHYINYAIQTNGILIDEKWAKLFHDNEFLVGISLDGFKANHDYFRLDFNNNGTFDKVMRAIDMLRSFNVEFNVLTVLTSRLAKYPDQLMAFYVENKLNNIQLIPCVESMGACINDYALSPQAFYEFYNRFFELWYQQYLSKNLININYFENIIGLFAGIAPKQCGYLGFCSMQFVMESDGSVYPCDFYVIDDYCLGNINQDSLIEIANNHRLKGFLNQNRTVCKHCDGCKFYKICYGNCKRMANVHYDAKMCALKCFMENNERKLLAIATLLRG